MALFLRQRRKRLRRPIGAARQVPAQRAGLVPEPLQRGQRRLGHPPGGGLFARKGRKFTRRLRRVPFLPRGHRPEQRGLARQRLPDPIEPSHGLGQPLRQPVVAPAPLRQPVERGDPVRDPCGGGGDRAGKGRHAFGHAAKLVEDPVGALQRQPLAVEHGG